MIHKEDKYTILSVDYQRNGVSGQGFYDVRFILEQEGDRPQFLAAIIESGSIPDDAVPWRKFGAIKWHIIDGTHTFVIDPMNPTSHWRGDRVGAPILRFLARHDGCAHYLYSDSMEKKTFFPHVIDEDAETHYEVDLDGNGGSVSRVWYGIERPKEEA
jgi:hypothetical protein